MRLTTLVLLALAACGQTQAQPTQECPACPECKPDLSKLYESEGWLVVHKAGMKKETGIPTCDLMRLASELTLSAPKVSAEDARQLASGWADCAEQMANKAPN